MRDEFSKHRCLGQELWRRLLEAAEKEVSRSFLCLWFVVSQSVMLVERLFFSRSRMRCCVERMCGCVCVLVYVWVLIKMIIIIIIIIIIKTTHTLPHMHNHTCSQQRILLREIKKTVLLA